MRVEYKNAFRERWEAYHVYYNDNAPTPWMRIDFILSSETIRGDRIILQQTWKAGEGYNIVCGFIIHLKNQKNETATFFGSSFLPLSYIEFLRARAKLRGNISSRRDDLDDAH